MPTTVTDTIKTSGGDFSTVAAWEDGTDNDSLITADELRVGVADAGVWAEGPLTVAITAGWTDATRYRVLRGQEGTISDSTGARVVSGSSGHVFTVTEDHFRFQWLGISRSVAGGTSDELIRNSADPCWIQNCWLWHQFDTSSQDHIHMQGTATQSIICENTFFIRSGRMAVLIQGTPSTSAASSVTMYNCACVESMTETSNLDNFGVVGVHYGNSTVDYSACTFLLRNVSVNRSNRDTPTQNAPDFALGGGTYPASDTPPTIAAASGFCAAGDTSASDVDATNFVDSVAYTTANYVNVTGGSEDPHIVASGAFDDAGESLSGVIDIAIDIDNVAYTGTWPIGADTLVAAGGAVFGGSYLQHYLNTVVRA